MSPSSTASRARALDSRDITVPIGDSVIVAISPYEHPWTSRRIIASRRCGGRLAIAADSRARTMLRCVATSGVSAGSTSATRSASSYDIVADWRARSPCIERVAFAPYDRQQPCARIRRVPERAVVAHSTEKRLLHHILRIIRIANEIARQSVRRVQMRQHDLVERRAGCPRQRAPPRWNDEIIDVPSLCLDLLPAKRCHPVSSPATYARLA